LDTIKKSVSAELPGKIAFTSSGAQRRGIIDFDNLNLEKGAYLRPLQGYSNTKLMVRISIIVYLFIFIFYSMIMKFIIGTLFF
jgi:hypothetical protein